MGVSERVKKPSDKERLDWLDSPGFVHCISSGSAVIIRASNGRGYQNTKIRPAIDAAIKASRAKSAKEGK